MRSIHKNRFNYLIIGFLLLPIFFGVVDFYSSFNTQFSLGLIRYINISSSQAVKWMILCILFSMIAGLICTFFSVKWFQSSFKVRSLNRNVVKKVNRDFKVIFLVIATYKISYIINFGLLEFALKARYGTISIGPALYFLFIMFPFILAYEISKKGFSWVNILSLMILTFLNLVTGFRLLLIYALAVIIIYNWDVLSKISKYKIIAFTVIFGVLLVGYELSRQQLQAQGSYVETQSAIDSLNRTNPLNTLQLIKIKEVSHPFTDVAKLWTHPIAIFFESFGANFDGLIDTSFDLEKVLEPLYSDFLAWRGTPTYKATGFAMSIVSYSYLFHQELGVFVFALAYGFFLAIGCKLISSNVYEQKIVGTALLVSSFLCHESVVGSIALLIYALMFFSLMLFFAMSRQTIINFQSNVWKTF
jgi:hypothetical protein